jgi:hypothetical protein
MPKGPGRPNSAAPPCLFWVQGLQRHLISHLYSPTGITLVSGSRQGPSRIGFLSLPHLEAGSESHSLGGGAGFYYSFPLGRRYTPKQRSSHLLHLLSLFTSDSFSHPDSSSVIFLTVLINGCGCSLTLCPGYSRVLYSSGIPRRYTETRDASQFTQITHTLDAHT